MKKIAVLMTLVLMLCVMPLTAFAAEPASPYAAPNPPATPNWKYTWDIVSYLAYEGTTMTCVSVITAFDEVTSIKVEQTLQKQGLFWVWAKPDKDSEWTTIVYDFVADVYNYKTVTESGRYRLKTVVTVTNEDGKSEKITIYSEELEI